MGSPVLFHFLLLSLAFSFPLSSSAVIISRFSIDTSLSVENPDILISPNGDFSAGFYSVGENAYCFAIWFNNSRTVVWMANRDHPVNGKHSKLSLLDTGNLILTDATNLNVTVWATDTVSLSSVQLFLNDNGNLVLRNKERVLWQSFEIPTDTLLPEQLLTRKTKLVSSRSQANISSGFYELSFDNDSFLQSFYNGPDASRTYYYNSLIGTHVELGNKPVETGRNKRFVGKRRGRLGLLISWEAIQKPCEIPGACGANSLCSYVIGSGRKCSCPPGYKMKNRSDWADGCEPEVDFSCDKSELDFVLLSHVDFYECDFIFRNYTVDECRYQCLAACDCKALQYNDNNCYLKTRLLNGYRSPDLWGDIYLKLPKSKILSNASRLEEFSLNCSSVGTLQSSKNGDNGTVKFMLWFAGGVGGLEIICIFVVWCLLTRTRKRLGVHDKQGHAIAVIRLRTFTYAELKKATKGFAKEIGRGAGGTVYKEVLSDNRVAAIKCLNEANQDEGQFLAEVSIIGKVNHMNLIEMWGYCVEGKHRLLVYEYMGHGSLADNLSANVLEWEKRFEIAMGIVKGLAYLHEDCLDWILHCDVKPQNILLDSNYGPKVADFGLSKLQNRNALKNSSFSRIRETRGYMAPEWVLNLPITSKVDVFSYGIVVLEMVTGKCPSRSVLDVDDGGEAEHKRLVTRVREIMNRVTANTSSLEEIIDPMLKGKYDMGKMEILVWVALQCVKEDKDERPTMSQVVDMLLPQEQDSVNS
ncbi:hypothetical protein ACB092_01G021800 [Castanea dentata]